MATTGDETLRQAYLPLSVRDVLDGCAESERAELNRVARLLSGVLRAESEERLAALKEAYGADDEPDPAVLTHLDELLRAAHYTRVDHDDLQRALAEQAVLDVRVEIDLDDFAELAVYYRGQRQEHEEVRRWFGLRREDVEVTAYERVCLLARFHDAEHFPPGQRDDLPFTPGCTMVKLFRDVPRRDVDLLFPNGRVKLRPMDKALIAVPAVISAAIVLSKLAATFALVFLLIGFYLGLRHQPVHLHAAALVGLAVGLGTIATYVWRQYTKFRSRVVRHLETLSENRYHKTMDDGAGVILRLLDGAHEQSVTETMLAYHIMSDRGEVMTVEKLDSAVESFVRQRLRHNVDFDARDAADRAVRLGLAVRDGDSVRALPPGQALAALERRWAARYAGAAVQRRARE